MKTDNMERIYIKACKIIKFVILILESALGRVEVSGSY